MTTAHLLCLYLPSRAAEIVVDKNKDIAKRQMEKEGFTALHIAAANDHVEIASLLLTKVRLILA